MNSLAEMEKARLAVLQKHLENGVIFECADGIVIEESVKIGKGTRIAPNVTLRGETVIGENCVITGGSSGIGLCTANALREALIGWQRELEEMVFRDFTPEERATLGRLQEKMLRNISPAIARVKKEKEKEGPTHEVHFGAGQAV